MWKQNVSLDEARATRLPRHVHTVRWVSAMDHARRRMFPDHRDCKNASMLIIHHSVVLAITKENVDAPPTLFKTYDTSAGFHDCTIWQVARATSAATTFFKSIKVGRDEIEFIDAGFGYNNPCEILIREAKQQFPEHEKMRVLSLGTGLGDVVTINNTRLSIIKALKKMAASSKQVAARLDKQYGDSDQYFRFNVDQGLQDIRLSDWEKASRISANTHNYLMENERKISEFVDSFTSMAPLDNGHDNAPQIVGVGGLPARLPSHSIRSETTGLIEPALTRSESLESLETMAGDLAANNNACDPCEWRQALQREIDESNSILTRRRGEPQANISLQL